MNDDTGHNHADHMPNTVLFSSGVYVDYANPKPEQIRIKDIALALSGCTRFCNQLKRYYDVAEHSTRMSYMVDRDLRLTALLHDAAEAYLGDIPRPAKVLLPDYMALEKRFMEVIAKRFKIIYPIPHEIKKLDTEMLLTEAEDLHCSKAVEGWHIEGFERLSFNIPVREDPHQHVHSYVNFLTRYTTLTGEPVTIEADYRLQNNYC